MHVSPLKGVLVLEVVVLSLQRLKRTRPCFRDPRTSSPFSTMNNEDEFYDAVTGETFLFNWHSDEYRPVV